VAGLELEELELELGAGLELEELELGALELELELVAGLVLVVELELVSAVRGSQGVGLKGSTFVCTTPSSRSNRVLRASCALARADPLLSRTPKLVESSANESVRPVSFLALVPR
jgi:hypothetical protein